MGLEGAVLPGPMLDGGSRDAARQLRIARFGGSWERDDGEKGGGGERGRGRKEKEESSWICVETGNVQVGILHSEERHVDVEVLEQPRYILSASQSTALRCDQAPSHHHCPPAAATEAPLSVHPSRAARDPACELAGRSREAVARLSWAAGGAS